MLLQLKPFLDADICKLFLLIFQMFRKYAAQLNTVSELNLLVCDEGHRLKKAEGSQTFRALW